MRLILRVTMLGSCALVGLSIALAVVLQMPQEAAESTSQPTTSQPTTDAVAADSEAAEPTTDSVSPNTDAPAKSPIKPVVVQAPIIQPESISPRPAAVAPIQAPYAAQAPMVDSLSRVVSLVAMQQDRLEQTLRRIQDRDEAESASIASDTQPLPAPPAVQPAAPVAPAAPEPIITAEGDERLSLNIQDSDIRDVLELLSRQNNLNILAGPDVSGTVSATLNNVDVYTALDAILKSSGYVARQDGQFIHVGTPQGLEQMQVARESMVTRVFRPNYVSAKEIQTLVTPLLSPVGEASVGASALSVSSPAVQGLQTDTGTTGGDDFGGSDVVVVRDYESVVHRIEQLVVEIDQAPRQVSIEAVIIGVRLDDSNRLGVNFEFLRDQDESRLILGMPIQNLAQIDIDDGGLKFGFLDSSLSVFIEALETIGDTDVVASPRVMCLNKQRAQILIGSQLGYVSTTVTENAATQAVEFLEVGTQLRIRPYISSDNQIRMEVHPELSTGTVRIQDGLTLPDKEVTQVTTNIMCRDGKTVVIGGLIREDVITNSTQIPWLGAMPLVGPVFRQRTEEIERRELIVLLTPRIVSEPAMYDEGHQAAIDFSRRQATYVDKLSPLGTRHIGRKYYRLAQSAWNAGDVRAAFRYVNLAIHFDPQSLDANNLRGDIVDSYPDLDIPLHHRLREGLPLWQRPARNYPRQGIPWQQPIDHPGGLPMETIFHPGQPGSVRSIE